MYLETIKFTSEWYYGFYKQKKNMFDFTSQQINEYESLGKNRGLKWME
jgi:CDP-glucose 4,6-dehydratase